MKKNQTLSMQIQLGLCKEYVSHGESKKCCTDSKPANFENGIRSDLTN